MQRSHLPDCPPFLTLCPLVAPSRPLSRSHPLVPLLSSPIPTPTYTRPQYLADAVTASRDPFPSKTICSAIFGLKKMKSHPEVLALLAALSRKIEESEVFYHPVNICIALNGE